MLMTTVLEKKLHKLPKSLGCKQLHQLFLGLAPFSCTGERAWEERGMEDGKLQNSLDLIVEKQTEDSQGLRLHAREN